MVAIQYFVPFEILGSKFKVIYNYKTLNAHMTKLLESFNMDTCCNTLWHLLHLCTSEVGYYNHWSRNTGPWGIVVPNGIIITGGTLQSVVEYCGYWCVYLR